MDAELQDTQKINRYMKQIFSKKAKRRLSIAAITVAAIFCVLIAVKIMYDNGAFLPGWVTWESKKIDIPGVGTFVLERGALTYASEENRNASDSSGHLTIDDGTDAVSLTDKSLKVSDILIYDVDGDGDEELVSLLWKRGKFCNRKPFWMENDDKWSQHIFIYDINPDGDKIIRQKWCTSEIGRDVLRWRILDKDENLRLKKDPKINTLLIEDRNGGVTLWVWDSFGLKSYDGSVSFVCFGDNLIHQNILEYGLYKKHGDFSFLYSDFRNDIAGADVAVLNLESVLVDDDRLYGGYPSFGAPIEVGKAVSKAGFDVVNCANNHILDKGPYGIKTTCDFFDSEDILITGIIRKDSEEYSKPYEIIVKNGIRIALFNYTYGTNHQMSGFLPETDPDELPYRVCDLSQINEDELRTSLTEGGKEADIVLVFVHWGDEYSKEISEEQKKYVSVFNECGVDVVVGTHPHVLQDVEEVKRADGSSMLVYYSLGNFRASQNDENTFKGGEALFTVGFTYDGIGLLNYDMKVIDSTVTTGTK